MYLLPLYGVTHFGISREFLKTEIWLRGETNLCVAFTERLHLLQNRVQLVLVDRLLGAVLLESRVDVLKLYMVIQNYSLSRVQRRYQGYT